jgi:hypothetical protein
MTWFASPSAFIIGGTPRGPRLEYVDLADLRVATGRLVVVELCSRAEPSAGTRNATRARYLIYRCRHDAPASSSDGSPDVICRPSCAAERGLPAPRLLGRDSLGRRQCRNPNGLQRCGKHADSGKHAGSGQHAGSFRLWHLHLRGASSGPNGLARGSATNGHLARGSAANGLACGSAADGLGRGSADGLRTVRWVTHSTLHAGSGKLAGSGQHAGSCRFPKIADSN